MGCVKLVAKATRKGLVFQEIWKTLRVEGGNKYMGRFKINEGRKLSRFEEQKPEWHTVTNKKCTVLVFQLGPFSPQISPPKSQHHSLPMHCLWNSNHWVKHIRKSGRKHQQRLATSSLVPKPNVSVFKGMLEHKQQHSSKKKKTSSLNAWTPILTKLP